LRHAHFFGFDHLPDLDRGAARKGTDDQNYYDRAQESDQQGPKVEPGKWVCYAEESTGEETTNQSTDNPDDNVTENAIASTFHDEACQPTRDQTNNDPRQNTHFDSPFYKITINKLINKQVTGYKGLITMMLIYYR
jgi:hypothetical protein